MAGRGTDIKLGEGVVWTPKDLIHSQVALDDRPPGESKTLRALLQERPCGLHVIGSERHESRRIDRQLRGRCARQGDPGSSRFYVSLEDNLMRLFGSDRIAGIMTRLGMQEGEPIEHRWLNHSIESAQRRVEQRNFSIRKRTLEYDDVMNRQRSVVYDFRSKVLANEDIHGLALDVLHDMVLTEAEERLSDPKSAQPEDYAEWASRIFPVGVTADDVKPFAGDPEGAAEMVFKQVEEAYELKCALEDPQVLPRLERFVVLRSIDREWQDYLRAMDDLRDAVRLRAYGQRDPLVEYKREAYGMFEELMGTIKTEIAQSVFKFTTSYEQYQRMMQGTAAARRQQASHQSVNALGVSSGGSRVTTSVTGGAPSQAVDDQFERALNRAIPEDRPAPSQPIVKAAGVGRNDPCPCGSGKKYKKCCGRGL
jgi:preprotein translocase subunit SecA